VGGLGSNAYLGEYLKKKLKGDVDVKQPMSGYLPLSHKLTIRYSAIMKGAVLTGLGLNLIKERLMRRSYGVKSHTIFVQGQHPMSKRYVDIDGTVRCRDVMNWYVVKAPPSC
jgi:hypothetical protein